MSRWPRRAERVGLGIWVIAPAHPLSLGAGLKFLMGDGGINTSTAWPSANRAILIPFRLPRLMTAYQMSIGAGATATGNFDVGIYDAAGNRLVSSGSTAKGNSVEHILNITDTPLGPGLYYMALAANGTNNYICSTVSSNAALLKAVGVRQASSAFALPSTVTFETVASNVIPGIAVYLRST